MYPENIAGRAKVMDGNGTIPQPAVTLLEKNNTSIEHIYTIYLFHTICQNLFPIYSMLIVSF